MLTGLFKLISIQLMKSGNLMGIVMAWSPESMNRIKLTIRHIPDQPLPTGDHSLIPTFRAQPVDLIGIRVEADVQLTGTRLPTWLPPASRLHINGDASLYGCGISDDLTKLLDLGFELGKPRTSKAFIEPVWDVDDPHKNGSCICC
jgi:hypothetical protein